MAPDPTKVLIVDDRHENLLALEALLEDLGLDIHTATSGNEALARMLDHHFAVVVMDVQMPGMDGFETVELMKQSRRTRDIPVLYVTAISKDATHVFRGYETGAVDYIFKPVDPTILRGKIQVFVTLHRLRLELEERNRQLEEATRKLREAALTDPLTGLHNRRFLQESIDGDVARARRAAWARSKGLPPNPQNRFLGFLVIDVDHFKRVNDEHGHDAGDAVLTQFAETVKRAVRTSDEVIRWGGEEFLVLLRQTDGDHIAEVSERIRASVAGQGFKIPSGNTIRVTCSVGFCCYPFGPPEGCGWKDVVAVADAALGRAKRDGRDRTVGVRLAADRLGSEERHVVLHDLEEAAERGLVCLQRKP